MSRTKLFMSYVLTSCFLVFFTVRDVRGGDVEFYLTDTFGNSVDKYCWICTGPYFRSTGLHHFTRPVNRTQFYTASDGIASQYGNWDCYFNDENNINEELLCLGPRFFFSHSFSFNLENNTISVDFVETGPTFEVRPTRATDVSVPEEVVQAASLGDDAREGRPDRDTFSFDATEGDAIILRLEEDPAKGHLGSQARLRLRRPGNGGSVDKEISGEVPIEMEVTVPETGTYEVLVEQQDIPKDVWFRGDYFVVLLSTLGDVEALIPNEDVEH